VRDENDRAALLPQRAQHVQQVVDLLRRQNRRRFVENEYLSAARQRL